jgi:RNA polymerase sigma-70 factor, ECF subfamily
MSTCPAPAPRPRPTFVPANDAPPLRGPADVLRRFREGDPLVLEGVYRTYVGPVTTIVRCALKASCRTRRWTVESTDLVQEVFVRAFAPAARRSFDGAREYGPYLYAVARNVVIDWARRVSREVPTDLIEMEMMADAQVVRIDEEDDARLRGVVKRYLAGLDPTLRAVVDVRYGRGLSQQEGARTLGLSRQSLRTLESRLRAGLRRTLKGHTLGAS